MAHDVFYDGDRRGLIEEVRLLVPDMASSFDHDFLGRVYGDVILLFDGKYPGYQASNTRYHNIAHTLSVFLATARLLHGTHVRGRRFTTQNLLLGMIAALFHDVGLIQEEGDTKGSGAKYTIGHEERSIEFMKVYLSKKDFSLEDVTDCSHFIMSTILSLPPKEIPFRSEEAETVGHIVGSADLLAQMADRLYLEKLLLLFEEFEEARLPGFDTQLTLLKKTEDFYRSVAKKRLEEDLGGVYKTMADHFQSRWDMNRDPYEEAIQNNLKYLGSLVDQCQDSYTCYLEGLRRGGITKGILDEMDLKDEP